jgi:VanZ family protein
MFKQNPPLKYRSLWLVVGYILVAYVIYSSLTPNPIEIDISNFDKYAHTFGYFVLMGWFMQIYHLKKNLAICALLLVCMGVALEFVQGMTSYRMFDLNDMLANTTGVLLASVLVKTPFPNILTYFEAKFLVKV